MEGEATAGTYLSNTATLSNNTDNTSMFNVRSDDEKEYAPEEMPDAKMNANMSEEDEPEVAGEQIRAYDRILNKSETIFKEGYGHQHVSEMLRGGKVIACAGKKNKNKSNTSA